MPHDSRTPAGFILFVCLFVIHIEEAFFIALPGGFSKCIVFVLFFLFVCFMWLGAGSQASYRSAVFRENQHCPNMLDKHKF